MKSLSVLGFLTTVAVCAAMAGAATINVGPSRTYTTVQAGVDAASPGDTVQIDAVTLTGNAAAATWTKDNLTIKGSAGTVLDFTGATGGAGLKADTGVTTVTFDTFEAKNASTNPCIISNASGTTTINNCLLHDAYKGFAINGGASFGATAIVTNCHIYGDNANNGGGVAFNSAGANVNSLTVKGCWIHSTINYGIKTWAKYNYVLYNRMGDEEGWTGNKGGNAVDFVIGGLTYVIGNTFQWATGSLSGNRMLYYRDGDQLGSGYSSQIYAVYNTILAHRGSAETWLVNTAADTLPAYVADNVMVHDGTGTLVNGSQVNNSLMINSNLLQYDHQGNNPIAVHRYMYDANGYDCGDAPGAGNFGAVNTYENWDVLNVRPVDPNTFPYGSAYSNTSTKMPLPGYQTLLNPGPGIALLVPGSNPLALPATGLDGTSLTPTMQYSNMPQVTGVAGGLESRANATDAIGAYSFAQPTNHQPVGTITSTMPPFIYEGWPTINMTATATDVDAGQTLTYKWTQTTGQPQTLTGDTTLNASFTVPAKCLTSVANELLTFQFVATDNGSPIMSSTPVFTSVTCFLCGDIDHDQAVILADLKLLVAAWNTTPASPNWNLAADLDGDHAVILADLKLLVANWNRSLH